MTGFVILLVAAIIFGICYAVDKAFTKAFRSKAQHRSGMAVRANKRYGIFGVVLSVLGVLAITIGITDGPVLLWGGVIVLLMGVCLALHYLTYGIFYDGESFLVTRITKKNREYRFEQIQSQTLYIIQGGSVSIDLQMDDGTTVSIQTTMDGVYHFLDTAFAGWCLQKHISPEDCGFYDPSKSWWFPHGEEA